MTTAAPSAADRTSSGGRVRRDPVGCMLSLVACLSLATGTMPAPAAAKTQKTVPSGTLLIPITPKIDTSLTATPARPPGKPAAATPAAPTATGKAPAAAPANGTSATAAAPSPYDKQLSDDEILKPAPDTISAEQGDLDEGVEIGEDTTLKGTIQLVADDTEYDQDKNTFLGTGNAVVIIAGENSKLEADTILYDQNSQTIDARGNVRIYRDGQLTTGSAFRFKVTSDEYLITNPDTEVQGATVVARKGYGSKQGLAFANGQMTLPEPIHFESNSRWGPISASEEVADKMLHPDAYLPSKPSFKFKARKMVYERYKESGNLTIFGGRVMFGKFGVPLPKFTATVGKEDNNVVFPVTPLLGNVLQMGGIGVGAGINRPMGKTGVFSAAPFVQIGGRNINTGESNSGKFGLGAKISYTNKKMSAHIAYGSVSNLVVADWKYQVNRDFKLQAGVNRFLEDGIFGMRRPQFMLEAVHNKAVGGIPFISSFNFRSAAGLARDNSNLLNLTPDYAKLFDVPPTPDKQFALRVSEQITAVSHPIFAVGDDRLGARMNLYGGLGLRGYSTGDAMMMAQAGPILSVHLHRARLQGGYTQSAVRGQSPFVFDQFIQGQRSIQMAGDVKVTKYLTLGASAGYNLDARLLYQRSINAAVGPDDFKVMFSYDTIRRNNRYGFDLLFGQPIPFNKLVLKGSPDHGQLGAY